MVEYVNETVSGLQNMSASFSGLGWFITILIFISIILILFLLSKNIRRFFIGAVTTLIFFGVYKLSRYIGFSASEGNTKPFIIFGYVVGFIVVSIIVGLIVSHLKIFKKIENYFKEDKK